MVGDAGVGCGDLGGRADVGFADLDETPTAGQQIQRGVDEVPGKAVEHHIHALPAGGRAERHHEIQGPRRRDVVGGHTQAVQHTMLAGVGGGIHLRTQMAGDLDGGLTHPAGAGVDEHLLPRRQPPTSTKAR